MTPDPTPHTERAAAAAAELHEAFDITVGNSDRQFAKWVTPAQIEQIIAKHFNDDAAKDAYHYRYALILAGCPEDDVDNPPDLINWARRNSQQHDALRLAAGRALELLERMKNGVPACDENGALYVEHFGLDGNSAGIEYVDPIAVIDCMIGTANAAITALSAALAGDKGKE